MSLKIVIFYGSVRPGRLVHRVGTFVKDVAETAGLDVTIFDPAEMPFEILKCPLHFHPSITDAPEWLLEANTSLQGADGFIVVSAEYNSTIPPALSNMLDHFPSSSYRHKPTGIVCYSIGPNGGIRVALQLRSFLSELGMVTIPTTAAIPTAQTSLDESGVCLDERLATRVHRLIQELRWYCMALKTHKSNVGTPPEAPMNG